MADNGIRGRPKKAGGQVPAAKFELGQLVLAALEESGEQPGTFLARHAAGDWGDLSEGDRRGHEFSLLHGFRLLSAYTLRTGTRIRVASEADRSATTILLPEEY